MNQNKFETAALEILTTLINNEKTLDDFSTDDIRVLLTYNLWQDGMDWPEVKEFIKDKEMSREQLISYLNLVFPCN